MPRILKNEHVIVTGGSSGIGKAIVEEFMKEGAQVVFTFKNPSKAALANHYAAELSKKYSGRALAVLMDVENTNHQRFMLNVAKEFFGTEPDILVNNAGIVDRNSFFNVPEDKVLKVMNTNFIGPFLLAQKISRCWIDAQKQRLNKRKELKESYLIVNIGSISGEIPTGMAIYESSKAALKMLTRAIAYELAAFNIFCNNIAPGLIPTSLNEDRWGTDAWNTSVKAIPIGRTGTTEDVASLVIAVAKNSFMNGSTVRVDGGRSVNLMGALIHDDNIKKRAN